MPHGQSLALKTLYQDFAWHRPMLPHHATRYEFRPIGKRLASSVYLLFELSALAVQDVIIGYSGRMRAPVFTS
jgi:hypothetical protein